LKKSIEICSFLINIKERVKYCGSYFKDKVTDIKVEEQKKRWASCTKNYELLFNWRCVMASLIY
jgi:Predicted metal-dependent hydrolase